MQLPFAHIWFLDINNGNRYALVLEIDLSTFRFAAAMNDYFFSFL